MIKNRKRIAILMATYNGEKYITEQLDSLLNQTSNNWTLYIHDDGSDDSTVEIILEYKKRYPDLIVIIEDKAKHLHARNNFFHLLNCVCSEYYMFCDQDDYWKADMIEIFEKAIDSIPNKTLEKPLIVHSDFSIADFKLHIINDSYWQRIALYPKKAYSPNLICIANPIRGANCLINNAMKHLLYPLQKNDFMYDAWISYVGAKNKALIIPINIPTNIYRIHESNCLGSTLLSKRHTLSSILTDNYSTYMILRSGNYGSVFKYIFFKVLYMTIRAYNRYEQKHLLSYHE